MLNAVPLFPEPKTIRSEHYAEALSSHTQEVHGYVTNLFRDMAIIRYLKDDLSWIEGFEENVAIEMLVTGSDGRGEKATFIPRLTNGNAKMMQGAANGSSVPSKMDMIMAISLYDQLDQACLADPNSIHALEKSLQEKIDKHQNEIAPSVETDLLDTEIFEEEVEVKSLHSPHPSGYFNNPQERWPTRIIDATSLTPSSHRIDSALRMKLVEEIKKDGKSMRAREQDRLKWYKRVCTGYESDTLKLKPGMQKHKMTDIPTHFDLDSGIAYYDRAAKICSFKYGPLRTVQLQVSAEILKILGTGSEESCIQIMRELPRNTGEKLRYMRANALIHTPESTVDRLVDNYHFFLREYHQSEWMSAAHAKKETIFAQNADERSDVKNRLSDLVADASSVTAV